MKTKLFILMVMVSFLRSEAAVAYGKAVPQTPEAVSTVAEEKVQEVVAEEKAVAAEPVEVGNKLCPVTGEEVGKMEEIVHYEYKGKIYNLCCDMCKKDFSKDPEKFSKIADESIEAADQKAESQGDQ